jgi:hypothetical protein
MEGFGKCEESGIWAPLGDATPRGEIGDTVKIPAFMYPEDTRIVLIDTLYHSLDKVCPSGKVEVFPVMLECIWIYAIGLHSVTLCACLVRSIHYAHLRISHNIRIPFLSSVASNQLLELCHNTRLPTCNRFNNLRGTIGA